MSEELVAEAPAKRTGKRTKKAAGPDPKAVLKLQWTLHELPSSQHRAGLAGLALAVNFLNRNKEHKGVCTIDSLDAHGLTLAVDREGMQSLFDDIYDASIEDTYSKSKWAGAEPKRIEDVEIVDEKTGKAKREKRFVYDRVVPKGALIADWEDGPGAKKLWLKLWQDLVWSTLRGVPAQREPFNARAFGRAIDDGGEAWDELATMPDGTVELASTHALGVQAKSAENVIFEDIARFRFLLHFWPFVVAIYVPAVLQRDGSRDFVGHALAIPEVGVLDNFLDAWQRVVRGRGLEPSGYLPKEAVIDLAAEAGLDVIRRADDVIAARQGTSSAAHWLNGVDVFHVEKDGNNVRLRGVARIIPERRQIDEYTRVRNASYWSPVFRRQRISNVLDGKPWWHGYARLCAITPEEMTISHTSFRHDCRSASKEIEMEQGVPEEEQSIEHLIFRLVQSYVLGKTERKYELSWGKAQGNSSLEADYREKREKVAREAFLAVRSRTGADFIAYFTSTLCSIPQHANEAKYVEIARALMSPDSTEKVRSLTLLALSAVA